MNETFFQPLNPLVARSVHTQACREVSDEQYVLLGVQRVLEGSESGRAVLQEHGPRHEKPPAPANCFAARHSARRCAVLQEVNRGVLTLANGQLPDRLAGIAELAGYAVFAADGHWHQAAAHDPRHEGVKLAVGHFYSLNLRPHTLRLLATGQGLPEHDLLLIYEPWLENRHGVENQAEDQRRKQRTAQMIKVATQQGTPISTRVSQARRATQRSVKFVRWLRQSLRDQLTEATAVLQLKLRYAKL